MSSRQPLAVLVGGAPGSGKTTVAKELGRTLDLPVLHKDDLVHGVWRSIGHGTELGLGGVELFYSTMKLWLNNGVSFIGDQTWRRGVSEPDVAASLAPIAELVHVHCQSVNAVARFERRMRVEPLCGDERLGKLLPLAHKLQEELVDPLDFRCPTITVDTTDGYRPGLESIAAWVDGLYRRPAFHDIDGPVGSV